MPTNHEFCIPPQSPKAQKKSDRQHKNWRQRLLKWTGFPGKTLWDWLRLVAALAIPVVIAVGTIWFSAQQSESSAQIAKDQQEENALQTYLDRMSDLLLNSKLRESRSGDGVRNIARARTLTILPQLNGRRKGELLCFLHETNLINVENAIVALNGADLNGVDLNGANLSEANLSGANLRQAHLRRANLWGVDLSGANLNGADLNGAHLSEADLIGANLSEANLSEANLSYAHLSGANLSEADLIGANLGYADLPHANITVEQFKQAQFLKGTTLPNGSMHP